MGDLIAVSFESLPNIFLVLFFLGIVVQSLFSVTLVTLSAVTSLIALNAIYTASTGAYWFVTINIGATVFLGMQLLLTDPATSPKTYLGRVLFGAGYACGYFFLFKLFNRAGIPEFWDKLLPVPVLNLMVPWLDRVTRRGVLGGINAAWERALTAKRLNVVHMVVWTAVFAAMLGTGYVQGDGERRKLSFWRDQYVQGKPHAGENLLLLTRYGMTTMSGEAFCTYGELCLEGKLLPRDEAAAAAAFAQSCELGWPPGCVNVAMLYLYGSPRRADSPEAVQLALDHLEELVKAGFSGQACALLARAYETGDHRPLDRKRALELFDQACTMGEFEGCRGYARVTLANNGLKGPIADRAVERLAEQLLRDSKRKLQEQAQSPAQPEGN